MESHLLFCINSSCIRLLATCLYSVRKNGGLGRLSVHIIHRDLTEADIRFLEAFSDDQTQLHFISFDAKCIEDSPTTDRYPVEIYFRLFAPEILPSSIRKILYLDVDTVCINPIDELYHTDIEDYYFAGCTHTRKVLTQLNAIRLGVGLDSDYSYLNTGVLLMNLERLAEHYDRNRIIDFIRRKSRSLILPDQDVIMALYGSGIRLVDTFRYNLSDRMLRLNNLTPGSRHLDLSDVERETSIIHYCGRYKPWKPYYKGQLGRFYHELERECGKYLDLKSDRV